MALSLEIVTPEARALTVQCDEVRLTALEGMFGIRPGHTPLVAALAPGELSYDVGGVTHRYVAGEGFAEVSEDRVRVLVEELILATDLDVNAIARELVDRNQKLAGLKPTDVAYELERAAVARAAARATVAKLR